MLQGLVLRSTLSMLPTKGLPRSTQMIRSFYLAFFITLYAAPGVISWRCDDGSVIRNEWVCDDNVDCLDGSDETVANCKHKICAEGMFRCNNTRCISSDFLCNGEDDCMEGDSSDEDPQVCMQSYGATVEEVGQGNCKNKFICKVEGTCFWHAWVCDGEADCSDGSDEHDCPCEGDTLRCHIAGRSWCLDVLWQCDGVQHCDRGEDETGCEKISNFGVTCDDRLYQCRSTNQCVPWDRVCDKQKDCHDGSDEGGLCYVDSCNKRRRSSCEQLCHNSPIGSVCSCFDGYRLSGNGVGCIDVDECDEMQSTALHNKKKLASLYYSGIKRICSQYCQNSHGSFHCTCADGYALDQDDYTCKAEGASIPELFVVVGAEIRVASIRDPGKRSSFYDTIYESDDPNETILDVAFYDRAAAVFWTEDTSAHLKMTSGNGVFTLMTGFKPRAVCVDWLSQNLIVTSKMNDVSTVNVMKLNGNLNQTELVAVQILNGVSDPVSVAVYPHKGLLVVADVRELPKSSRILISKSDGSESKSLVHIGKLVPTDVIVDTVQEAVIWSSYDDNDALVESIKFDGSHRGVIMSRKTGRYPIHPLSVTVFESHLYVADQTSREVRSWYMHDIELYGKQNTLYDSKDVVKLRKLRMGVARMSHPVLQRPLKGVNPCESATCNGVCILVPRQPLFEIISSKSVKLSARCLCPAGQTFDELKGRCELIEASKLSTLTPIPRTFRRTTTIPTTKSKRIATTPGSAESPTSPVSDHAGKGRKKMATCHRPPPVRNSVSSLGVSSAELYRVGYEVVYFCNAGHSMKLFGQITTRMFTITCLSNGSWDRKPMHCVPVANQPAIAMTAQSAIHQTVPTETTQGIVCDLVCSEKEICVYTAGEKRCVCRDNEGLGDCNTDVSQSTGMVDVSSPPSEVNVSPSTVPSFTTVASRAKPSGHHSLSTSEAILTVLAVSAFFVCVFLFLKCARKKRYSVDLRFTRAARKDDGRKPIAKAVASESTSEAASFANPNYQAGCPKRMLKPTFDDNDSGVRSSLSSRSSSSSLSDTYGGEKTPRATAKGELTGEDSGLLPEDPGLDNDFIVEEMSIKGSAADSGSLRGRVGRRLEKVFKIRRTESRECMLPQSSRDEFSIP